MKVATPGFPLQKIDYILNDYLTVCKEAVEDDRVFAMFKCNPDYNLLLEHLSKNIGESYLNLIYKNNKWLLDIKSIWTNDMWGNPKLEDYSIDDLLLRCSPTTLQYIGVLSNIIDHIGSLNGLKIVEIGGGYGGQCKVIQDVFNTRWYTIIDLEEANQLQQKYLSLFKNITFEIQEAYSYDKDRDYDLVISNYSITELVEQEQRDYINNVCLRSKHGYLTCNNPLFGVEMLKEKFKKTLKISRDIEGERDTNYLITW